jgi:hypothetical protein
MLQRGASAKYTVQCRVVADGPGDPKAKRRPWCSRSEALSRWPSAAIRLSGEELGIFQQDLGLELGYDSHVENNRRTNPAYRTVDRLARALSRLITLAESIETEDRKPLDRPLRDVSQTYR